MEDRDELKEFASRVGRDVSDEELEDYFTAPETSDDPAPAEEEGEIPVPEAHLEAMEAAPGEEAAADDLDEPQREKSAEHGQA
jgi:hypothetical protein